MVARDPASEPVEDCELCLRIMTGFRFVAAVAATTFLVGGAVLFSSFVDDEAGGGRISVLAAAVSGTEDFPRFFDDGGGGGGIFPTVLLGFSSPSLALSLFDGGGDANLAVGRGLGIGVLFFLRMG